MIRKIFQLIFLTHWLKCAIETFKPKFVAPGSQAAALFCEWIIAVYALAIFERTQGLKKKN